ncbi:carbon-nitrogen hydrolase family protein [Rhodohalobacter sp.]|uniref:carbon-nitrogen hydrolase family protein n=1 Tax=Rhodohalobacter sp. TaxID=1974210 RepID=UPI002ACE7997|nr:carbon-nitrogen hydrolase family protein [Rhodohalobacter sp.]MDZ7754983.1 carbon-nitrogen hydrolase family protein [Rhodohalobacter sp.]
MKKIKAAAIQLNSQPDVNVSLNKVEKRVREAAEAGAKLICLPENFAFLGDEREKLKQSAEISKQVEKRLPELAKQFGVTINGGGYPTQAGNGKIYNRSIVVNPNGKIVATYDKIHLFDVDISDEETWRESDTVQAGKREAVVYKSDNLPAIGLSICYDLRFPELYRKMADEGVEIITIPSAFTRPTGEAHWEPMMRTRAIENSSFLIAAAQTGVHGEKRKTWGHSMIIDPWGKILADAGTEPGVIYADLDMEYLKEVRKKLPSLEHRVL